MKSIIERTGSVEDALAIAGTTLEQIVSPSDTKDEAAYKVMKAVIKVLNEDVPADYSDPNQKKYEVFKSGFGLSYYGCDGWFTYTGCGPRLCYLKPETAKHGIKILEKFYNDFFN